MFRVTKSPIFWSDCAFEVLPDEPEMKPKSYTFKVQFPRMSPEEFKAFSDHIVRDNVNDDDTARLLLLGGWRKVANPGNEIAQREEPISMRWKGVVGADDVPLPLDEKNLADVLSHFGMGAVISKSFMNDMSKAAAKN